LWITQVDLTQGLLLEHIQYLVTLWEMVANIELNTGIKETITLKYNNPTVNNPLLQLTKCNLKASSTICLKGSQGKFGLNLNAIFLHGWSYKMEFGWRTG
jgi:hypothetical protein